MSRLRRHGFSMARLCMLVGAPSRRRAVCVFRPCRVVLCAKSPSPNVFRNLGMPFSPRARGSSRTRTLGGRFARLSTGRAAGTLSLLWTTTRASSCRCFARTARRPPSFRRIRCTTRGWHPWALTSTVHGCLMVVLSMCRKRRLTSAMSTPFSACCPFGTTPRAMALLSLSSAFIFRALGLPAAGVGRRRKRTRWPFSIPCGLAIVSGASSWGAALSTVCPVLQRSLSSSFRPSRLVARCGPTFRT